MVFPAARYCTSDQPSPASASAARAANAPYSTKFRPHLPHSCMPTPSTTTGSDVMGRSAPRSRPSGQRCAALLSRDSPPLPDGAHGLVVLGVRLDHELHRVADG